jgi:hypothetical protein
VQAINGLLDRTAFFGETAARWRQQATAPLEPKQKGRREAGLFSSSTGAQNGDQYFAITGPPQR